MTFDKLIFEKIEIDSDFRYANGNKFVGAKILINGEALLEKVKAIETPYAVLEGHLDIAGGYNHQIASSLYKYLTKEKYWDDDDGVALFTCSCLEDGCWCIRCFVKEMDSEIIWHNFRHEHRKKWDYSALGEFHFDKEQYNKEVEKLKQFTK